MAEANDTKNFPKINGFNELLNSAAFSQANLKGILALSDSLRFYTEQNKSIVDQVIKANSLRSSVIDGIKLSALSEVSKIIASQSKFTAFEKVEHSSIFAQINATNISISKLLKAVDSSNISKLIQQTSVQSDAWIRQFQAIDSIAGGLHRYDLVLQSHIADISKFSALSQISLSRLAVEGLGNALKVEHSIQSVLQNTFVDFAKSYSNLFASFSDNPSSIISLPPTVSRHSAVEFFNGVRVAQVVTVESAESELDLALEEETHQLEEDVQQETESILEKLLKELNLELIVPLHGARQSLASTNPDKARHLATSLRELFTHVLHTLSPDEKVKEWSNFPEHYDRGKPTRRARLLYICRSLNHASFSDFIEKDIDAVLEFLRIFKRGTHEIVPRYTDLQLRMMLVRMESALRFLLEIWRASDVL